MTTNRLILSGLFLLSACGTHSAIEISRHHTDVGDYQRAYEVLDEAVVEERRGGGTPDEDLETAHRMARIDFLRYQARQNIFEEREDAALSDLALLRQMVPGDPEAEALHDRAVRKKALRLVQKGDESILRKDLHGAMAAYLAALKVMPSLPQALEGSDRVKEALSRLSDRAQAQFLEAVRKMPEFRYVEVRWHADIAVTNDPQRDDAQGLARRAQRELAVRALERGRDCLAKDQFGAAMLEFRTARKLDPSLPGIDDEVAQAEREVEVTSLVERAQRSMRIGQFDVAREQLGKALGLTTMAKTAVTELMVQAKRLEGEAHYQAARDLEVLGKKTEALAAFEELAKAWPDGLLDEKGRIEALRIDTQGAATEWAAAEAAEAANDPVKALLHYEAAMQFYPGWKDGPDRVKRLRQTVAPRGGSGQSGSGQSGSA